MPGRSATGDSVEALRAGSPLACRLAVCSILNHMVQYSRANFDASFAALSDATRRGVLEQAGLVITQKVGRVRTCKLGLRRLAEEAAWIERYRQLWAARFDALDKVVEELKRRDRIAGRKQRE